MQGCTVVLVVASQQGGSWFNFQAEQVPFCVKFACSPSASVGFPWLVWLPPTVKRPGNTIVWLTGHSKNRESKWKFFRLHVRPVMGWGTTAGTGFSPPAILNGVTISIMGGWLNTFWEPRSCFLLSPAFYMPMSICSYIYWNSCDMKVFSSFT